MASGLRYILNWVVTEAKNILQSVIPVNKQTVRFIQIHRQDLSIIAYKMFHYKTRRNWILRGNNHSTFLYECCGKKIKKKTMDIIYSFLKANTPPPKKKTPRKVLKKVTKLIRKVDVLKPVFWWRLVLCCVGSYFVCGLYIRLNPLKHHIKYDPTKKGRTLFKHDSYEKNVNPD